MRRLHFGAPPFEGIEEHDSRRSQVEDAVSHTSNLGVSEDLTNKHRESTELEVTVPKSLAYVDEAPKASVNDNVYIEDANVLLSERLMQPPSRVFDKYGENGETAAVVSEDLALKVDGIEIERREDLAEVGVLEEDRRFGDTTGDVVNDQSTGMEVEDPQLSLQITPEGRTSSHILVVQSLYLSFSLLRMANVIAKLFVPIFCSLGLWFGQLCSCHLQSPCSDRNGMLSLTSFCCDRC